jgi:DNA-binding transcriptional regulator PaaX
MGSTEEGSRKRARRANLKKAILETVRIAGIVGVAALAPNVMAGFAKLGIIETERRQESIRRARTRMIRQGFLRFSDGVLSLTAKGEQQVRKMRLTQAMLPRQKRWDGKWRVLIFDIANRRRGLRDKIRQSLKGAGFSRLQDSVWVFPYPCDDFIALLKSDLRVGTDMQYLIVDTIENDVGLRATFGIR